MVGVFALSVVTWLTVEYVLPWLLPWLADNTRPVLWLIAAVAVAVGLNQLHRPWYVELQRQGLTDAPRRVWRVQGWRRSGRLMGELTAAIQEGRIDRERGTVILRPRWTAVPDRSEAWAVIDHAGPLIGRSAMGLTRSASNVECLRAGI